MPLENPKPILTGNGPILPTHSAFLQLTTTVRKAIKLPCVLCPQTDESFVSLLDSTRNCDSIIIEKQRACMVPEIHAHKITKHFVSLAEVHDNAFIIKTDNILPISTGMVGGAKSASATETATARRPSTTQRLVLKVTNPNTKIQTKVFMPLPKRGRPRKHKVQPERTATATVLERDKNLPPKTHSVCIQAR